jgi:acyl transferase domain-containing protein/NAD(P)H-dependent flavin oxidoreductase YrpB (nitropropane dioxygenase family)
MSRFSVVTITPIGLRHPGLALASARAGGIAVLDREFCDDAQLDRAQRNLAQLIALAPDATLGIRLRADQIAASRDLLAQLRGRHHWLIISGWQQRKRAANLADDDRVVVLEAIEASDIALAKKRGWKPDAWILRGSESGGWIGSDAAFILLQKHARQDGGDTPFYVQGGIGPVTAAGCLAAGAAGVVLDDQLWLMPESPLKEALEGFNGPDAQPIGDGLGASCRVLLRPRLAGAQALQKFAADCVAANDESRWRSDADALVGWGSLDECAWPVGQGIALAAELRDRFKTTGRLVTAIRETTIDQVNAAARLRPLAPDAPLARSHRTRYPIVQGPMTRVSDSPGFAEAVAEAGGLPLLALALMSGEQVRTLLDETRERLGERSWGVGILGFVPPDRRDEQLAALTTGAARPPFALIAGGRPDQAAELERHGIATYLHVPMPKLLHLFLEQGARRFIFEGRECGGHVGPLSSFVLWESMVQMLLREVPKGEAENVHVLFAGGIHDALSTAIVAAIAAPLNERGMKTGVLMGSAYLFTREAVSSGAIVEEFQDQALRCERTVKLKTGPGHVVRVAPSPFASEFEAARRMMTAEGKPQDAINDALALLALGRSRVAAKGVMRDGETLVALDRNRQRSEGMFMMGSIATMRSEVVSIAELHDDVSAGNQELLEQAAAETELASPVVSQPADIAVIGMGCLLPGAPAPKDFWQNILSKTNSITEIPKHRFDWRLMYSPDTKERDKSYSKWGGFLDEVPFDPLRFGIPPNSMPSLSTSQLLALEVARQALADAGYEDGNFDRENTSVILGAAANGDLEQGYMVRGLLPFYVDSPSEETLKRLPEWSEESFAGVLANVTAGRIANRLDLGGANYTVDAACASSLTAIDLAVHELRGGNSEMVIAGGLDLEQHPHFYLGFSRTQAFSPRGKVQTFDRKADGIVISEGVVVVVLKRLADAERDGDRIYAVIKGIAGSSDGKGLGMTAPRPIGQRRALARAYRSAGFSPSTIGLYEAHGPGTAVGDRAELETIVGALQAAKSNAKSCAVGSVKTLIGHTKAAAGMCGLVKAVYALHHRTLPPHAGVDEPLDPLADPRGPVYLLRDARPWFANGGAPRRAGVSAFGFGGTNFHAVLEEYGGNVEASAPGGDEWPSELIVFRAAGRDALIADVASLRDALASGAQVRLADLAASLATKSSRRGNDPAVLVIVTGSIEQLRDELDRALAHLRSGEALGAGSKLNLNAAPSSQPVAFLFPGQGAQHLNMVRELALYMPEVRAAIEQADALTAGRFAQPLSRIIYPETLFNADAEQQQAKQLDDTRVAQPAIGAVSAGMLDLARRLGLAPAMVGGHSFGELTALHAAGVLDRETFLALAETRGRLMAGAADGAMAVVTIASEALEPRLPGLGPVVIANANAPQQCVISGPRAAVEAAVEKLGADGITARLLPVSGAFHSPLMAAAEEPLVEAIAACELASPQLPVYGNATARPYPANVDALRSQLEAHLRSSVNFAGQIRAMAADGARVFIEIGPKNILTGLVQQILPENEYTAVSLGNGGMRGFLGSLATLMTAGVAVDVSALFAGRALQAVDLDRLAGTAPPSRAWWVDGGGVRRTRDDARNVLGTLPRLNLEDVERIARAKAAAQVASPNPSLAPAASAGSFANADLLEGYRAHQETMRKFLAVQESVMSRFLGFSGTDAPSLSMAALPSIPAKSALPVPLIEQQLPVVELSAPEPTPAQTIEAVPEQPAEVALTAALDRAGANEIVVRLVSDRTGYPPDVLGLEQDIEAELGIDSIKRMEIVDALLKRLPENGSASSKRRADEMLRLKTLKGWVDVILRAQEESAVAPAPVAEEQPVVQAGSETIRITRQSSAFAPALFSGGEGGRRPDEGALEAIATPEASLEVTAADIPVEACPRYVIAGYEEPAPLFSLALLRGLFLITEDAFGIAAGVASSLRQLGGEAIVIERAMLEDPKALAAFVAEQQADLGPVQGIVHLAPLAPSAMPATLAEWRKRTQIDVKSLFQLLRIAASDLQIFGLEGDAYALGATLLGGAWGRNGVAGPGMPSGGGTYGLLKTLTNETTGVNAKAIDFDDVSDLAITVPTIVNELLAQSDDFEVGYRDGNRSVFRAEEAPVETATAAFEPLPSGGVVLITGGARGITAEIARSLARPGVRIVLAGRAPEPVAESSDTAALDATGLRRYFLAQPRAAGERVTPAMIEEQIRALLQRRESRQTLDTLRQLGAEVEYHSADVRSERDLANVIDGVYACFGRIDAVVHGAGIIEDKLLADKDEASFDRVFDTKADSAFLLTQLLRPESLKWVLLFSSVAGRIGNRGQIDYAAANEVLNRMAWWMAAAWPSTRVVAVNWGPWSGAGMASPAVIRQLEESGIRAIAPPAGRQFLFDELASGARDAEVMAGKGYWGSSEREELLTSVLRTSGRRKKPR